MADATTQLLQLLLQETGSHENAWGALLNQGLQKIEDAIAGATSLTTTGSTITLTDDQARPQTIIVSGALTTDAVIVVPARFKSWLFLNATTGDHLVFVRATEATGFILQRGQPEFLWCDGGQINLVGAAGQVPVGTILDIAGAAAPSNYLICDGSNVSRLTYGRLFSIIGTRFGAGDGLNTFAIPNGLGRYRRGAAGPGGGDIGTYLAAQIESHIHGASAAPVGDHVHGLSQEGDHSHAVGGSAGVGGASVGVGFQNLNNLAPTFNAGLHGHTVFGAGGHGHAITIAAYGADETRPASYVTLPIIRFQ